MADDKAKTATFRINVEGNAAQATKEVSRNARLAAESITKYEEEIKTLSGDLRRLRGNSDDVKSAKAALKEKIDRARTSVSLLTTELGKQGESYATAAKAAKQYGTTLSSREAWAKIGGGITGVVKRGLAPLGRQVSKVAGPAAKKLGTAFDAAAKKVGPKLAPAGRALARFGGGAKRSLEVVSTALRPVTSALPSASTLMAGLGTVAVTATAAVAALGAAVIAGGVALGAFGLASADASAKMNRQRQALLGNAEDAGRLGDQITALAGKVPQGVEELQGLALSLSKTRLSGTALVNTMQAVAQATGAVDASAGAKLQEIVTRGQDTGRLFLGLRELQGTGIDFDDVAKEYAAGTRKSIDAARKELMAGAVPIEQGADALRRVTEKKFGALNIANAFSLENAPRKFLEQFKSLTAGVDLSPITKGLQSAFEQLSPEAPLGRGVKTFMDFFVGGLADAAGRGIPLVLEGFKWLVVGALRVGTHFYEMKKQITDAFSTDGWVGVGKSIVMGLVKGIVGYHKYAIEAVVSLGKGIKDAFTGNLEIKSPSRAFDRYGESTTEGYVRGVERSASRARAAVTDMVAAPAAAPAAPASSGPVIVNIHGAPSKADELSSPVFLASLTRAVRDALVAA